MESSVNWLIIVANGAPVFIRLEDAQMRAALASFQERTGVKVQR